MRVATADHIPALQVLTPLSARELGKGFYSDAQIEGEIKYVIGVDTQLIADGTYFVADANGVVVGCGGWSRRNTLYGGDQRKETLDPLLDPKRDAARIRAFFVHPQWARQGIGRRLIVACEVAAKGDGFTRMELMATLPGEPLYAALGYVEMERVVVGMGDGGVLECVRMGKGLG